MHLFTFFSNILFWTLYLFSYDESVEIYKITVSVSETVFVVSICMLHVMHPSLFPCRAIQSIARSRVSGEGGKSGEERSRRSLARSAGGKRQLDEGENYFRRENNCVKC